MQQQILKSWYFRCQKFDMKILGSRIRICRRSKAAFPRVSAQAADSWTLAKGRGRRPANVRHFFKHETIRRTGAVWVGERTARCLGRHEWFVGRCFFLDGSQSVKHMIGCLWPPLPHPPAATDWRTISDAVYTNRHQSAQPFTATLRSKRARAPPHPVVEGRGVLFRETIGSVSTERIAFEANNPSRAVRGGQSYANMFLRAMVVEEGAVEMILVVDARLGLDGCQGGNWK